MTELTLMCYHCGGFMPVDTDGFWAICMVCANKFNSHPDE